MTELAKGLHPVPAGHLATIVTYLEMTASQSAAPAFFPDGYGAARDTYTIADYRALFRAIGTPWLWTSRLIMDDGVLDTILRSPDVETWTILHNDTAIGLVELDFRVPDACELAFFGLISTATGQGLGRPMMALAQSRAFGRPIRRFHVHTCTFDAPNALQFYQQAGFTPYRRDVEIFPDPRLSGLLPMDAGAHIPCLT